MARLSGGGSAPAQLLIFAPVEEGHRKRTDGNGNNTVRPERREATLQDGVRDSTQRQQGNKRSDWRRMQQNGTRLLASATDEQRQSRLEEF